MLRKLVLLTSVFLSQVNHANADEQDFTGFVAYEQRLFSHNPQYSGQESGNQPNLVIEPEYYSVSEENGNSFTTKLFYRYDPNDNKRTHFDIRQFDLMHAKKHWELSAGISKVFWGVTESRHLVDILNQTDTVEQIDGEEKLGQPMIQYAYLNDWGTLRFFYLPYFRERTFTGRSGRLRSQLLINSDDSQYANKAEEFHPDYAIRYEQNYGDWDIGLANFYGTSREAVLRQSGNNLVPFYEIINQQSLDLQYTIDSWLWKLEAIHRKGQGDNFLAMTGGFEYSFFGILSSTADLGLLYELSKDGRDYRAPSSAANNDSFVGLRYSRNNTQDSAFLIGLSIDHNQGSQAWFAEASTRIGSNFKIELEGALYANSDIEDLSYQITNDDFIQLNFAYYY